MSCRSPHCSRTWLTAALLGSVNRKVWLAPSASAWNRCAAGQPAGAVAAAGIRDRMPSTGVFDWPVKIT